jgi:predicted small lipoprotein YifL
MIRLSVVVLMALFVALVAACGVDGEPEPPEDPAPRTGVTVSGHAEVGITF